MAVRHGLTVARPKDVTSIMNDRGFRRQSQGLRVRKDHAPENFAVLRHIALNILSHGRTGKDNIRTMRLRSGWDETYLAKL